MLDLHTKCFVEPRSASNSLSHIKVLEQSISILSINLGGPILSIVTTTFVAVQDALDLLALSSWLTQYPFPITHLC